MKIKGLTSKNRFRIKTLWKSFGEILDLRLDASTVCQLKCPLCPTASGANREGIIGWGYLKLSDFKKLIRENPCIRKIELSNWGEIFLNPEINEIIRHAYERKIELTASNGSNLNKLDKETAECLVRYNFRFLSISLDGATDETYRIYRRGGNLEKVLSHIKLINHFKKKYNSKFPLLRWQFIVFGHNEHEIGLAKEIARKLNMDFYPKLNYDPDYAPIKDSNFVKKMTGLKYASREEFRQKKKKEYAVPCKQLWLSPQINWDGKLLGCCMNTFSDFGNVFESGLQNCLKSERYIYAKKLLMGKVKGRDDIPCTQCYIYLRTDEPVANMF